MESQNQGLNTGSPTGPKKKDNGLKIMAIAISIVVIVVLAVIMIPWIKNNLNNNNGSEDDDDDDEDYVPVYPDLRVVTYSCEKTTYGDRDFTVKVTNLGTAIGSATIKCTMEFDSSYFQGTEYITLAPGETDTFSIFVDIPATYLFDSGYYSVDLITY